MKTLPSGGENLMSMVDPYTFDEVVVVSWNDQTRSLRPDTTYGGKTATWYATCIDSTNTHHDQVVKLAASPGWDGNSAIHSFRNEYFANALAPYFCVNTPRGFCVDIPSFMAEPSVELKLSRDIRNSVGHLNYGSAQIRDVMEVGSEMVFTPMQVFEAYCIVVFDLVIRNPDRQLRNPNLFVTGQHLVCIDHEMAFSFMKTLRYHSSGTIPNPMEFSNEDVDTFVRKHAMYPHLVKSTRLDRRPLIEALSRLDQNALERICSMLPVRWTNTSEMSSVREHMSHSVENIEAVCDIVDMEIWS